MITHADVGPIGEQWPELSTWIDEVCRIARAGSELPMPAFYEPVSVVQQEAGKQPRLLIGPDDLRSWCRHSAFRTRIRLEAFETAVIHALARGNILAANALLRSHVEAAALVVYCLRTLTDCARRDDGAGLNDIIYKTMFGTALNKYVGRDEQQAIADLLSWVETQTIHITKAIGALDEYVAPDGPRGQIEAMYAILCEFAHPNLRGTLDFMNHSAEAGGGWTIEYRRDPMDLKQSTTAVLSTLLLSMRAGYSAAELLRRWDFRGSPERIEWVWPDHGGIWDTFLRSASN